jgi:hypothetical protein
LTKNPDAIILMTMQHAGSKYNPADPDLESHIKDEIDFARALTALILAARLDEAEMRAEETYRQIMGESPARPRRLFL